MHYIFFAPKNQKNFFFFTVNFKKEKKKIEKNLKKPFVKINF